MRILVHDSRFQPRDHGPVSAVVVSVGDRDSGALESGWSRQNGRFVHTAVTGASARRPTIGWSTSTGIRHADDTGPVRDFYGYNGGELRARQRGHRPRASKHACP